MEMFNLDFEKLKINKKQLFEFKALFLNENKQNPKIIGKTGQ